MLRHVSRRRHTPYRRKKNSISQRSTLLFNSSESNRMTPAAYYLPTYWQQTSSSRLETLASTGCVHHCVLVQQIGSTEKARPVTALPALPAAESSPQGPVPSQKLRSQGGKRANPRQHFMLVRTNFFFLPTQTSLRCLLYTSFRSPAFFIYSILLFRCFKLELMRAR